MVLPPASLATDMSRRIAAAGTPHVVWYTNGYWAGIPKEARLFLIQVELAVTTAFVGARKVLHEDRRSAHTVIDETHLSVTWNDFRLAMQQLIYLRALPVQFPFLSANLIRIRWRLKTWLLRSALYCGWKPLDQISRIFEYDIRSQIVRLFTVHHDEQSRN